MAGNFFAGLLNGNIRMPDSAINYGNSPLPSIPPGAPQFNTPDGVYNAASALLPGGLQSPYAFGTSARISTQTQMAHPNKVAAIVPKLYIPSPESDGLDYSDPRLEHAISDGDLAFSFRMGLHMTAEDAKYYQAPHGCARKAVQLINLATVNYILWGLQVGLRGPKSTRWRAFFNYLTKIGLRFGNLQDEDTVWNFIRTYIRPFGIQHGGDQQGGMHEGDDNRVVTHGAVDYVSSFAIEGKLRHVNNLWRDYDVRENDDLILALRYKAPPHGDLHFVLSSSVRATRNERVPVSNGFYYLRPEVLQHRSFTDIPYIHVGRSQIYCSAYTRGLEACCWNARMPVTPGAPLLLTFEPDFVGSDRMFYRLHELDEDDESSVLQGQRTEPVAEEAVSVQVDSAPHAPSHAFTISHVPTGHTRAPMVAPPPPPPPPPPAPTPTPAASLAKTASLLPGAAASGKPPASKRQRSSEPGAVSRLLSAMAAPKTPTTAPPPTTDSGDVSS
jgi:hypothetical protein